MFKEYRSYLFAIMISALFGWWSLVIVVERVGVYSSPQIALPLFYATLFIALASSFSLFGYFLRIWVSRDPVSYTAINISLRQGSLLSLSICSAFVFQHLGALTIWTGVLLVVIALAIEFYFMASES